MSCCSIFLLLLLLLLLLHVHALCAHSLTYSLTHSLTPAVTHSFTLSVSREDNLFRLPAEVCGNSCEPHLTVRVLIT